jgi:hypothetical protein
MAEVATVTEGAPVQDDFFNAKTWYILLPPL